MMDTLLRIEDFISTLDKEIRETQRYHDMLPNSESACASFYEGRINGLEHAVWDLKILRDTLIKVSSQETSE